MNEQQRAQIARLRTVFPVDNVRVDPLDQVSDEDGYNGRGILVHIGDWREPTLGSMLISPDGSVSGIYGGTEYPREGYKDNGDGTVTYFTGKSHRGHMALKEDAFPERIDGDVGGPGDPTLPREQ